MADAYRRCTAYTKDGLPCSCSAKPGSEYCGVHRTITAAEVERRKRSKPIFVTPDQSPIASDEDE